MLRCKLQNTHLSALLPMTALVATVLALTGHAQIDLVPIDHDPTGLDRVGQTPFHEAKDLIVQVATIETMLRQAIEHLVLFVMNVQANHVENDNHEKIARTKLVANAHKGTVLTKHVVNNLVGKEDLKDAAKIVNLGVIARTNPVKDNNTLHAAANTALAAKKGILLLVVNAHPHDHFAETVADHFVHLLDQEAPSELPAAIVSLPTMVIAPSTGAQCKKKVVH